MIRWRPRVAGRSDAENGRERGMVTAELAVALPALLAVLVIGVNALMIGVAQIRCVDAARVAARAAARGDPAASVVEVGARVAPRGAGIAVSGGAGTAGGQVTVRVTVAAPGPIGWLAGGRPLRSSVTTPVEQSAQVTP